MIGLRGWIAPRRSSLKAGGHDPFGCPRAGRRVLRIWASRYDYFGFEMLVRVGPLPAGRYDVALLDLSATSRPLFYKEFVLRVK